MENDVGALDIKNRLKAAAKAGLMQAGVTVAPGILNDAKNAALKLAEKAAPGAGTAVQNYVTAKENEYKKKIVSGYVITGVVAVIASYILLKRRA